MSSQVELIVSVRTALAYLPLILTKDSHSSVKTRIPTGFYDTGKLPAQTGGEQKIFVLVFCLKYLREKPQNILRIGVKFN